MRMVTLSLLLATANVALTGCLPTLKSNDPPVVKQTAMAVPAKQQVVKKTVVKKPVIPAQVVVAPPLERDGGGGGGGGDW